LDPLTTSPGIENKERGQTLHWMFKDKCLFRQEGIRKKSALDRVVKVPPSFAPRYSAVERINKKNTLSIT
jgi:hypothetical protein